MTKLSGQEVPMGVRTLRRELGIEVLNSDLSWITCPGYTCENKHVCARHLQYLIDATRPEVQFFVDQTLKLEPVWRLHIEQAHTSPHCNAFLRYEGVADK